MNAWRVVITGATGQLGTALRQRLAGEPGVEVVPLPRATADLAGDAGALRQRVLDVAPQVLINAAAFTAVDAAETQRELAMQVNARAVEALAAACERLGARLMQISTDYVFAGDAREPYPESATPAPCNWYGRTKLAGEGAARRHASGVLVVRTAGLFAATPTHRNFPAAILEQARQRIRTGSAEPLRVVDDQTVAPTFAPHLAEALWRLLQSLPSSPRGDVVHLTAQGRTTWYGFAEALLRRAGYADKVALQPVSSAEYAAAAQRPAFSLLANDTAARLGCMLPTWQQGLEDWYTAQEARNAPR